MEMLALPLGMGKERLMSCSVVFSLWVSGLRAFDGFVGFLLWVSFDYLVYVSCVLRGASRFLINLLLLIKKKGLYLLILQK
jgi:hypothetical protein